jgi:hypothetical protein
VYVELDVYSGRENPAWELTDEEQRQLAERFTGRTLGEATELPDRLGFRRLIVSATSNDANVGELPPQFALGAQVSVERAEAAGTAAILSGEETLDAVRWLLNTSGAGYAVEELTRHHVEQVLTETAQEEYTADASAPDVEAAAPCQSYHMPFNPGFWSNDPNPRINNNCYNHAVDNRTSTFAQSDRQCGHTNTRHSHVRPYGPLPFVAAPLVPLLTTIPIRSTRRIVTEALYSVL